ncbi:hypothetical protein P1P75_01840 [Streptomyces sp. ID05-39B]|nr:hypothetical protein [Streptomyces sp. ID05-39B]MDX3525214.1 hypothetical protein [Streptomyces sp. ID05-39B]
MTAVTHVGDERGDGPRRHSHAFRGTRGSRGVQLDEQTVRANGRAVLDRAVRRDKAVQLVSRLDHVRPQPVDLRTLTRLGHDQLRARPPPHPHADGRCGEGREERHLDSAEPPQREQDDGKLAPPAHQHPDPVPRADPPRTECGGEPARLVHEFTEGQAADIELTVDEDERRVLPRMLVAQDGRHAEIRLIESPAQVCHLIHDVRQVQPWCGGGQGDVISGWGGRQTGHGVGHFASVGLASMRTAPTPEERGREAAGPLSSPGEAEPHPPMEGAELVADVLAFAENDLPAFPSPRRSDPTAGMYEEGDQ